MFHSLLSSTTGVTCSDKSHKVLLAMISFWFVVLFVFFYYCMIVAKTIKSVYTFTCRSRFIILILILFSCVCMSRLEDHDQLCSYVQQVSILKVTGWVEITMRQFMNNKAL